MSDHEHVFTLQAITPADNKGVRTASLICECGFSQDMLTTRTDAELAAEGAL